MESKILDISVIVPIHELDVKTEKLLVSALASVSEQEYLPKSIVLVAKDDKSLLKQVNGFVKKLKPVKGMNLFTVVNSGETDFCSQVNLGVENSDTKFFSILEFDDEFTPTYFRQVNEFLKSKEFGSSDAFLPTTILTATNGQTLQFVNNSAWAQGFTEKIGELDLNVLLENDIFMIGGAVISKEKFQEVGGLKKDVKVYFTNEFLLRFVNADNRVVVLPKVGYKHMMNRDGSLFHSYRDAVTGITPEEAGFYLDIAKKEYHYNPNEIVREIKYSPADVA